MGTVLIVAFAGPLSGLATGVLSSVAQGYLTLFNSTTLPFATVVISVYGGTTGAGMGTLVWPLRQMGKSLLGALTLQSFTSNPLDKGIVLFLALTVPHWVIHACDLRPARHLDAVRSGPRRRADHPRRGRAALRRSNQSQCC